MSEFVYKDYTPANARVLVDYGSKEKVKFSYPINWSYRKAVWKRAYPTILGFWGSIHYLPIIYLGIIITPIFLVKLIFFPSNLIVPEHIIHFDFLHIGLPILIYFFYLLGIPAIITFILSLKKEWLANVMPKLGYWSAFLLGGRKEVKFGVNDVFENKLIIHNFSNVYLDYKCSGDFNKYLKKVEIIEIPFNFIKRKFFLFWMKKKQKNDFQFRAVFYFKKEPKRGKMEVKFI